MLTNIENHGKLIEQLRKARKMSREDLCENIMSRRNYQRFITGDVSISADRIMQLIDKLGLDYFMFSNIFKSTQQNESSILNSAFDKVSRFDFKAARILLSKIDKDSITSNVNMQAYEFINILINRKKVLYNDAEYFARIEKVIDFPNVLNKKVLNKTELNALVTLLTKSPVNEDIIEFFINLLNDSISFDIVTIRSEDYSTITAAISMGLFRNKRYKECIEYADLGIKHSKNHSSIKGLTNLHGYKALALTRVNEFEMAEKEIQQLYHLLMLEGNNAIIDVFNHTFKMNIGKEITEMYRIEKEV